MRVGSADLSDDAFVDALDEGRYPAAAFHHADHLRLGWILLSRMPFDDAVRTAEDTIRALATRHGASGKFHATVTRGWMVLLASHDETSFDAFLERHRDRLSARLLNEHWSEAALDDPRARVAWVPPDRRPLPPSRR